MNALKQFTIPIKGLKTGIHSYDFEIDNEFFSHFEDSPIETGKYDLKVYFDKREDMLVFTFDFKGSFKTECDRCLKTIQQPINGDDEIIVKYGESSKNSEEVVYISRDTFEINIANYIYEALVLAIPVTNTCDGEINVCDPDMLKYLENDAAAEADNSQDATSSSPWDVLKDFNKK